LEHHVLKKRRATWGQSVVEFAIILPVFLALVGATADVARVYSTWIGVHAATRDAAEFLASNPGNTVTTANASSVAVARVNDQLTNLGPFTSVTTLTCTSPQVQVTYSSTTDSTTGASVKFPLGRATVNACLPFRTLFNYPFITQNGAWGVSAGATYEVLQNRQ
jgi:Flp pilus assembly protein TadG